MGLISAGLSTLEGLIQSLSTTITNDIVSPLAKWENRPERLIKTNKIVIIILGIVSILISYNQIINPNLSVGILAQNGVYAFFSAAFVPVLFGIFVKEMPKQAAIAASITAIMVHFSIYYGELTPYTTGAIRNPAVAAAIAIISALVVGTVLWQILRNRVIN